MAQPLQSDRNARRLAERQLTAWIVLCALLLFAALAGPFFLGDVYTADDLAAFHLPLRAFYAACLAAGDRCEWLPGLFNGFFLHGEGQVGLYHPWHAALYRWLPLRAGFCWELLASYPLLCLGMYVFLRRQTLPRYAAWFGGLVTASSGFCLLHFVHPNAVAVWAHLPWLLTALDARLQAHDRRTAARWELVIALLTASQLLLGYPQYVWMSLVVEACFVVWRMTQREAPRAALGWIAVAVLLGASLAAVQLVPTLEALRSSTRQVATEEFASWGSLHPANVIQLVAPYALARRVVEGNTHELGLYCGAAPLALVVWLAVVRPPLTVPMRRLVVGSSVLAALASLLALGQYTGLYRLQTLLPVVGSFRFPCRYIAVVQLAVAVLAAVALTSLAQRNLRGVRTPWRRLSAVGLAVVASIVVVLVLAIKPHHLDLAGWPLVAVGPLLIAAAVLLVAAADRGARWALPLLVVMATVDAGAYGLSYAVWPHHERLAAVAATSTPEDSAGHGQRVVADLAPFDRPARHRGNQLLLAGWRRADGYAGLAPARQLDYTRPEALRVAGVAWVGPLAAPRVTGLTADPAKWTAVRGGLPRFRLVARAQVSRDPAADLPYIDPLETALVDAPLQLTGGPRGHFGVATDKPGEISLLVDAPSRQLLVVAESYHADWRATVDGQRAELVRVYGDFFGCVVPAGTHRVEFSFRSQSLRLGSFISAASLVAVLGLFLFRSLATNR